MQAREGDATALDRLLPLVYEDLHRRAMRYMNREKAGHTLQPTALVHEAFLSLVDQDRPHWKDRAHFLATAARAMRQLLVQHARRRDAARRGGRRRQITLSDSLAISSDQQLDLLDLDEQLERLTRLDERKARVVELRFFGGMTNEEAAAAMGIPPKTAEADWYMARAWLRRALSR